MGTRNSKTALVDGITLDQHMENRGVDPGCQTHSLTARDMGSLMINVYGTDAVKAMSGKEFTSSMRTLEKKVALSY
jgi:hypothetical protein